MPEIVIVGGGIAGTSLAFSLASLGARDITLVDKGAIGSGETAKSGGFVQTHWDTLAEVRLIAWSREVYANFAERVGGSCGWTPGGYLHVTGSEREADVRRVHAMLVSEGLPSTWLDPQALTALLPTLATHDLVGGAWEPTSGWCDPLATTRAYANAARARGVTIREHVQVTQLLRDQRITGVATEGGELHAPIVVLAAGPFALQLHAVPERPLPIDVRRGQISRMSRPHVEPTMGFYDEVTGVYCHPLSADENLVGRDRGAVFPPVPDPAAPAREASGPWVAKTALALGYRFPALRESLLRHGTTGLYDFTPDDQPLVGAVSELPGYFLACGFSGVGFKSAPATMHGLAEQILGRAPTLDIAHLAPGRFA